MVIAAAFLIGGLVKGLIGGGLPSIVVPVMAIAIDPAQAAALTVIPIVATNIWQAGGNFAAVLRRFWRLLLPLSVGVGIGVRILVGLPPEAAAIAIGLMVVAMSPLPLIPQRFPIRPGMEPWLHPLAGGAMGVLGGVTVIFTPTIVFFSALRLDKDFFVATLAMSSLFCMVPLYLGLGFSDNLDWGVARLSLLLLAPTILGMAVGTVLRGHVSRRGFQWLLSSGLVSIGCGLVYKGFG